MAQADGCRENRLAHLQNLHPADDLSAFSPCPLVQASKESFSSRKNVLLLDVEPKFGNCAALPGLVRSGDYAYPRVNIQRIRRLPANCSD